MKKYLFIFLIIGLSTSCKKFLNTKPTDFVSPVNYYSKESELEEALAGAYYMLTTSYQYQDGWWDRLNGSNDESWNFTGARQETYSYIANNSTIATAWNNAYTCIERLNLLLENIDNVNISETKKNTIKGQALFLRGFNYFMLVSHWGGSKLEGVPLRTASIKTPNDGMVARTPTKEVYAQVIADLTEAQSLLPHVSSYGFNGKASKTAAQGILARVNLTMTGFPVFDETKYGEAKRWCDSVILSGEHQLNPDYPQIFINHSKDLYDIKECLWEIEFWGNLDNGTVFNQNSRLGYNTGPYCTNIAFGYGAGLLRPNASFYTLYGDSNDIRRDWNISPYYFKNPANPGFTTAGVADPVVRLYWGKDQLWQRFTGKWYREQEAISPKSQFACPTNFPVIRYSDILLMHAEADMQINGPSASAIEKINQVRRRAFGTGSKIVTVKVTNEGSGYTTAPAVLISGGNGKYAHADAVLSGGKVTGIRLITGGAYYNSTPTITIVGGGGSGATAVATIESINPTEADLKSAQTASKDALLKALQDERARELCYEAQRKPDLIRWGIFVPTMKALAIDIRATAPSSAANMTSNTFNYKGVAINGENVQEKHLFFPIPEYDIALNPKLTQNPGW
jgi:hypothetical protein